jgi:hypothetical protein
VQCLKNLYAMLIGKNSAYDSCETVLLHSEWQLWIYHLLSDIRVYSNPLGSGSMFLPPGASAGGGAGAVVSTGPLAVVGTGVGGSALGSLTPTAAGSRESSANRNKENSRSRDNKSRMPLSPLPFFFTFLFFLFFGLFVMC